MARTITYSIVGDWQLPETVSFAETGLVEGYFTTLTGGGDWQTATDLGSVNRNASVTRSLTATPQAGASIVNYSVRGESRLPLGLYLNSSTGQLSGTVGLWPRDSGEPEFGKTPKPTWNTPSDLGIRDELDEYNVTLSATPLLGNAVTTYSVISGYVPLGLYLGITSGELFGTFARMEPTEEYLEKVPKPVITPATFANVSNGAVVNYAITASPPNGQSITNYMIQDGFLPWGLRLNPTTGTITGTVTIPLTDMPNVTTFNFDVRVTVTNGAYSTASFSISIA